MTATFVRHTLLPIATMIAGSACAGAPAKPPEAPLPAVMSSIEGYVNGAEIRCSWGMAKSCMLAGEAYDYGLSVPRNVERALSYFRRACSLGVVDGCVLAGVITVELRDRAHFADVLATWEAACEKGSYAGCNAAGLTLAFDTLGMGTPRDMPRARTYLAKACAARYLPACGLEAVIVVHLKETSNYSTARKTLVEACELRDSESCHYLAQFELHGTFGPVDERSAGQYFLKACKGGWGASCAALADMWAKGIGTTVDPEKAKRLYSYGCALKHQPACDALEHPDRPLPPP